MRSASAALKSPVIASNIRAVMTSRTARLNCRISGFDFLGSHRRNSKSALGLSLNVMWLNVNDQQTRPFPALPSTQLSVRLTPTLLSDVKVANASVGVVGVLL